MQPTTHIVAPDTERVLAIMIDYHLGDFTIALPVIEALAAYYEHGIDLAVFHSHTSLVKLLPSAAKIHMFPYVTEKKKRDLRQHFNFAALAGKLALQRFQAVFTLSGRTPCALLTWATRAKTRIGTEVARNRWAYNDIPPRTQHVHRIDIYAPLLTRIGIQGRPPICKLVLPEESQGRARESVVSAFGEATDYAVIHPTAGKACREWPADRFAHVADQLITRWDMPVCLVGTPAERERLDALRGRMEHAQRVAVLTESLDVTLSLLKFCRLFVCNFSGPTHLAGLSTEAPIVCISGPTNKEHWALLRDHDVTMLSGPICKTRCKKDNCTIGMVCMRDVTVEQVLNAIDVHLQ
ncbi:glycosyltransferase family 9 protein [Planctomycetota bacterium]